MKRIIVTRFSAMGDVAMLAAVIREFQQQNRDTEIIMVSRSLFSAFFDDIPRLIFHAISTKDRHKGLAGLIKLYRELAAYYADYMADAHNNIRSKVIRSFFKFNSTRIAYLDKGRAEKKALIKHQIFHQLSPMTERYADIFRKLGFSLSLSHQLPKVDRSIPSNLHTILTSSKKKIGVAPFAQHAYKVWSLEKMEAVISYLSSQQYVVFVFGGGEQEKNIAEQWSQNYPGIYNTIDQYAIREELDIIAHSDLMISMDSAGMHMASLVGTRCVSIWGATHPFAGFLGYGQAIEDCVQVEHANRPSSVYGNKPCDCDGIEVIELVTVEMVISKVLRELDKK